MRGASGVMGNGGGTDVPAWVFEDDADKKRVFEYFVKAGRPEKDALILANQDGAMRKEVLRVEAATPKDPDLLQWWEQRRGDPYYNMTPEAYAKYVASQQELAVHQGSAGLSPELRAARLEEFRQHRDGFKIPPWAWVVGGGALLYFMVRK